MSQAPELGDIPQQFSDRLEAALLEALPTDDPLDQSNFSPLDFVNAAFPNGILRLSFGVRLMLS